MTKLIAIIALLAVITLTSQAQNRANIKGKVVDSVSNEVLEFATVAVLNAQDSSLVSYTTTIKTGEFTLRNLPAGVALKVVISFIGYNNFRQLMTLEKRDIARADVARSACRRLELAGEADDVVGAEPRLSRDAPTQCVGDFSAIALRLVQRPAVLSRRRRERRFGQSSEPGDLDARYPRTDGQRGAAIHALLRRRRASHPCKTESWYAKLEAAVQRGRGKAGSNGGHVGVTHERGIPSETLSVFDDRSHTSIVSAYKAWHAVILSAWRVILRFRSAVRTYSSRSTVMPS